jgi:hypothetical protein
MKKNKKNTKNTSTCSTDKNVNMNSDVKNEPNEETFQSPQESSTLNSSDCEKEEANPMSIQQKSIFMSFLKQLASAKGDLHSLSCPAFLISGISLLEYVVNWMDFPDVFARIEFAATPQGEI